MEKRLFAILIGGTVITGIAALILLSMVKEPLENSYFNKQAFNPEIWHYYHDKADDRDNPRGAMANDLKARLIASRPNRQATLEMLGEPEIEHTDFLFRYSIGMWSNNRSSRDTLDIYFDAQGKFNSTRFSTL